MAGPGAQPLISVVVCTYTERRWSVLSEAISALRAQTLQPRQIVVIVDHEPALLERIAKELEGVVALPSAASPGLAGCRNTGARAAIGSVVAFIDDDAVAESDWLERLAEAYTDENVVAVGGAVIPRWSESRPAWFPPEFDWVVGCTYRGLPEQRAPVRNLIGANMSFRREVFDRVGRLDRIDLLVNDIEREGIKEYLTSIVPKGVVVREPASRSAQTRKMIESFDLNLTALAFIALFVSMFIIYNTMLTNTLRRRRELGILRALDGTMQKRAIRVPR